MCEPKERSTKEPLILLLGLGHLKGADLGSSCMCHVLFVSHMGRICSHSGWRGSPCNMELSF